MKREKIILLSHICIITASAAVALYFAGKYLFPAVLPFILSFLIAYLVRRPADFLSRKTGASKKLLRPLFTVLVMLIAVGGALFAIFRLSAEAWQLFTELGEDGTLTAMMEFITDPLNKLSLKFGVTPELEGAIEKGISGIISSVLTGSARIITGVAGSVPKILLFIMITAVSGVYFSLDLEKIIDTLSKLLPKSVKEKASLLKDRALSVIFKYARSYFLIMLIIFILVLIGFTVLGVRYALLLAFITAILDLLPIVGIGIVLIPYSIISFAGGNAFLGVGLLILYAAVAVTREILEPKIVGKNLGIHPLLTLILIYVGYELFGLLGLLFLPLAAVILASYFKSYRQGSYRQDQ